MDGKVNSASEFNENSFEKTDKNLARLKVASESMSGIAELQPGAEVPMRLMPEGTQYKKGDIIVFYRDEIKIVHQVEYVFESNGEIFYVTTGVNTETNQYVDSDLVSQDDVIGVVDLSKEAYLALNDMMTRRYVPFITAFGITQDLQNYVKFLNKKSYIIHKAFYNVNYLAKQKGLKLVSQYDSNIELDFKEYQQAVLDAYERGKYPGDAILTWKHEKCGHVWENTYNNIKQNIGICPECDSPWKNEILTNKICRSLFEKLGLIKDNYQKKYSLRKIFPNLDVHASVHVDGFVELTLTLKDENGKDILDEEGNKINIKLAIEYQGRQHDKREEIGFKAYKFLTHNLELKEDTQEYKALKRDWLAQIKRDKDKVIQFDKEKGNGYFLIVVNYDVKAKDRQKFIIDKFKELTGYDLSDNI